MDTAIAIAEARIMDKDSIFLTEQEWARFCAENKVPPEVSTRMQELLRVTKKVGQHTINIGRLLVSKIIEFVRQNPNLTIGIAIGAVLGVLVNAIPYIGPLLSPLVMAVGVFIGGAFGAYLDKQAKGQAATSDGLGNLIEGAVEAAKKFMALLIEIFQAIKEYVAA